MMERVEEILIKDKIHIAVIPDGNRRFGKEKEGCKLKGYEKGVLTLGKMFKWFIKDCRLETLTLYCFSEDNWKRDDEEVEYVMNMFRNNITNKIERYETTGNINHLFEQNDFKDYTDTDEEGDKDVPDIIFKICSTDLNNPKIPEDIKKTILRINEKYKNFEYETKSSFSNEKKIFKFINICFSYDGQKEISQAFINFFSSSYYQETKKFCEKSFRKNLLIETYPDIILRTSGEKRLSSFLLWQCRYSELFFLDKKWPELEKEDFNSVIEDYLKREKRYGK